jgi:hypothetical protein
VNDSIANLLVTRKSLIAPQLGIALSVPLPAADDTIDGTGRK